MHFIGMHAGAQGGVDLLVALDQALAFEHRGHNGGVPVASVALEFAVVAGDACGDQGLELVSGHAVGIEVSYGVCSQCAAGEVQFHLPAELRH